MARHGAEALWHVIGILKSGIALEGLMERDGESPTSDLMTKLRLIAPESAVIGPDGSVWLFDRNGTVLKSAPDGLGGFMTPPTRVAYIGGGRTLGAHFDADGNLVFCHPPLVTSGSQGRKGAMLDTWGARNWDP